MIKHTLLIIDDDPTLVELLGDYLHSAGYDIIRATNGRDGLEYYEESQPDLLILDVMMPGMDGWQVCEAVRAQSAIPIILLTAKGEEVDKLRGFGLGVDDYVTKPFSFAELAARVRAVLARVGRDVGNPHIVSSGGLEIDLDSRRVTRDGWDIDLSPREYRLLEILARQAGRPIATETLLDEAWGPEYVGEPNHVKHYVWALRQKIETDPGDPQHIITERGFGYRFD